MQFRSRFVLTVLALLALPAIAHAQGGCENSPENPTLVLALIGSAATGVASLRRRLRRNKDR